MLKSFIFYINHLLNLFLAGRIVPSIHFKVRKNYQKKMKLAI